MRLTALVCGCLLAGILNLGCDGGPNTPTEPLGAQSAIVSSAVSLRNANPRAAVKISNSGCFVLMADGSIFEADRDFVVATQSTHRNTLLICRATGVPNSNGRAVTFNFDNTGRPCVAPRPDGYVLTTEWRQTISASNVATLRCRFKQ